MRQQGDHVEGRGLRVVVNDGRVRGALGAGPGAGRLAVWGRRARGGGAALSAGVDGDDAEVVGEEEGHLPGPVVHVAREARDEEDRGGRVLLGPLVEVEDGHGGVAGEEGHLGGCGAVVGQKVRGKYWEAQCEGRSLLTTI